MIYFFYPNHFLWENTINLALKNIARESGKEYHGITYTDLGFIDSLQQQSEPCIVCIENNYYHDEAFLAKLKRKFPNSKIVMFSGDTVYYKPQIVPDLLFETMKECIGWVNCPTEHFYWSISEDLMRQAENTERLPKEQDCICLCNGASNERRIFMGTVGCLYGLDIWNLEAIFKAYSKCWVALGHTVSVWENRPRSMKGFRDWIAPFCDTVLIYDNYPDIIDIGVVPTYEFKNPDSAKALIERLKNEPEFYAGILKMQKEWAYAHTLEYQIGTTLRKHDLL